MSKSELIFAWEDNEIAGMEHFKCGNCGNIESWEINNRKVVNCYDGFKCPECGQEFKLTWTGMKWEEK